MELMAENQTKHQTMIYELHALFLTVKNIYSSYLQNLIVINDIIIFLAEWKVFLWKKKIPEHDPGVYYECNT